MQAGQAVIDWAQSIIDANPGLPTLMTTHDFIMPDGERKARAWIDLASIDPTQHLGAEQIWQSFLSKNDQIFMIFCGHYQGQAYRADKNDFGNNVYQLLSNYQGRGKSAKPKPGEQQPGLSDGWLRLINFDFSGDVPVVNIRTYSTFYKKYSNEIPEYSDWYRELEHPEMTDEEFNAADHFTLRLDDFKLRFGDPK